jgi:hypothetical protein
VPQSSLEEACTPSVSLTNAILFFRRASHGNRPHPQENETSITLPGLPILNHWLKFEKQITEKERSSFLLSWTLCSLPKFSMRDEKLKRNFSFQVRELLIPCSNQWPESIRSMRIGNRLVVTCSTLNPRWLLGCLLGQTVVSFHMRVK